MAGASPASAIVERRVGAVVLEMQRCAGTRCAPRRRPAPRPRCAPRPPARRMRAFAAARPRGVQRRLERRLAQRAHVGEAHAVRRQHARQRMDEHARHAERIGDRARVLAAGAAEAAQRVVGDVVAALHRDVLDRVGHVLHRDAQEAVGDLLGRCRRVAGCAQRLRRARRSCARTTSASSGSSPSAPNTCGNSAGSSLPSITLQSVTVSGPPRR